MANPPAVSQTTANTLASHARAVPSNTLDAVQSILQGIATIRTFSPLKDNIAVGIYGMSGAGKSTELNVAFQDAIVFKTLPTVTRPYYSIVREQDRAAFDRAAFDYRKANDAWGAQGPEHRDLLEKYADQAGLQAVEAKTGWRAMLSEVDIPSHVPGSTTPYWYFMDAMKNRFLDWTRSGHKLPFSGGIFDEMNEIFRFVFEEMKPYFPPKKVTGTVFDDVPTMTAHEAWVRDFIHTFRSNGLLLGAVFQEAGLTYDEDKNSKFYGKMKYPIGPRTPFGRERFVVTEACDVMLRITLDEATVGMPMLPAGTPAAPGAPAGAATAPPSPGGAPALPTGPAPGAAMGPSAATTNPSDFMGVSTLTDADWPTPLRPIPGHGARYYWTAARNDILAKFRDINVSHREPLGLRRLLRKATYL